MKVINLILFFLFLSSGVGYSMEKIYAAINYAQGVAITLALDSFKKTQNINHENYSLLLGEDSDFYVVIFYEPNPVSGARGGGGKSFTYKINKLTFSVGEQEINFSR